jgi:hypothetical protein
MGWHRHVPGRGSENLPLRSGIQWLETYGREQRKRGLNQSGNVRSRPSFDICIRSFSMAYAQKPLHRLFLSLCQLRTLYSQPSGVYSRARYIKFLGLLRSPMSLFRHSRTFTSSLNSSQPTCTDYSHRVRSSSSTARLFIWNPLKVEIHPPCWRPSRPQVVQAVEHFGQPKTATSISVISDSDLQMPGYFSTIVHDRLCLLGKSMIFPFIYLEHWMHPCGDVARTTIILRKDRKSPHSVS